MNKKLTALLSVLVLFLLNLNTFALSFPDVNEDTPYANSITWMAENGVINGNPDGTFAPDRCVNRAEMLKLTFEILDLDLNDYSDVEVFSDMNGTEWYAPYVRAAREKGTIQGYQDGEFKGSRCVSRAEALKIADLEFGLGPYESETNFPIDVARELSNSSPWWGTYFYNLNYRNVIGTDHVTLSSFEGDWSGISVGTDTHFSDTTYDYNINEAMSRKEVTDLLFRLKTIKDSNINYYGEELQFYPNDLVSKFDSCGDYSEYSQEDWFLAFSQQVDSKLSERFGVEENLQNMESTFSEGCLSLDGSQFISILDYNAGIGFCGELYSYDLQTGELTWPEQAGQEFYCANAFGKRVGNYVEFSGERNYVDVETEQTCNQSFEGKYYFEDNGFSTETSNTCS